MKLSKILGLSLLAGLFILAGCAPSVSVTPAGHDRQYEITVRSNDFTFSDTEDLIDAWHQKSREACHGNNYRVITRDIINKEEPFNELLITGIIECD